MITRIVKMVFRESECSAFENIFNEVYPNISKYKGCSSLSLFHDSKDLRVYFTFSTWDEEKDLENYRQSELFKDTWRKTKPLFEEPAQAWSVQKMFK